jgi:hypothetical protein
VSNRSSTSHRAGSSGALSAAPERRAPQDDAVGAGPARGEIVEDRARVRVQSVLVRRGPARSPVPAVFDEGDREPLGDEPLRHPDVVADDLAVPVEVDDRARRRGVRELHRVHRDAVRRAELDEARPCWWRHVVGLRCGIEEGSVAEVA